MFENKLRPHSWTGIGLVLPAAALFVAGAGQASAMHIMEGYLPARWCGFWYLLSLPAWILGYRRVRKLMATRDDALMTLGLAGAFIFVLSALKIPSLTGSCSHPTGTGLGVILFGPSVVSVLSAICLLFQAVLLAHGGLTTLGANSISMGIVGPFLGWLVWRATRDRLPRGLAVFLTAVVADLLTYVVTAIQLSLAYPDPHGGVMASVVKFMGIYAVTQIPLALIEGIMTALIVNSLSVNAPASLSMESTAPSYPQDEVIAATPAHSHKETL